MWINPASRKLKAAIRLALTASGDSPDREVAVFVATKEAALVAIWAEEKLAILVRAERSRGKPADASQMSFPFDDLSIQLCREGETFDLRGATIGMLKQSEKYLMAKQRAKLDNPARANSLLGRIQREIELMQPYVYANRRLTVEQVHSLVSAGTPAPPRGKQMSEAMKRYWGGFSPDERSEIAQQRQAKRRRKSRGANG